MNINQKPNIGAGYIYILSNPSMPNIYKVGLTTGELKKRIQELNSTGVPQTFVVEHVFEVPETKLRSVEQLAHRKLKLKGLHHGKEFFEGQLFDCVIAVQDAIFEIIKIESPDLVGQAKQRAIEKAAKLAKVREKENRERLEKDQLEKNYQKTVSNVREARLNYIKLTRGTNQYSFNLIFFGFLVIFFSAMVAEGFPRHQGKILFISIFLVLAFIIFKINKVVENITTMADMKFPMPIRPVYKPSNIDLDPTLSDVASEKIILTNVLSPVETRRSNENKLNNSVNSRQGQYIGARIIKRNLSFEYDQDAMSDKDIFKSSKRFVYPSSKMKTSISTQSNVTNNLQANLGPKKPLTLKYPHWSEDVGRGGADVVSPKNWLFNRKKNTILNISNGLTIDLNIPRPDEYEIKDGYLIIYYKNKPQAIKMDDIRVLG